MLITNILSFIFIITILVVIHELGHFLAAKSIGLKVEKFYVGFNLFGLGLKKKINDTEFGIGLFPVGGYVKVAGMVDESLDDNYQGKEDEYISKTMIQKVWFTCQIKARENFRYCIMSMYTTTPKGNRSQSAYRSFSIFPARYSRSKSIETDLISNFVSVLTVYNTVYCAKRSLHPGVLN